MSIKKIGSPHPKYLAATDILISDMSNINYDFLLFNRPIILLANRWLIKNFPDIGIKTDLNNLENAIKRSIEYPDEFKEQRVYWHKKTMHQPDGKSSERVLNAIIKYSKVENPVFTLLHGNNEVMKVHLDPLYDVIKGRNFKAVFISDFRHYDLPVSNNEIFISAHNELLQEIPFGFRVHIDHSVKGVGVTDFENQILQFKEANYFQNTDLHITEGEVSFEKTKKCLGPFGDRAVMVGYPKSDELIRLNNKDNRKSVFDELGFNYEKLLITYAPTGKYSYPFKQGASLSNGVLRKLSHIADKNDYNILIKLRSHETFFKKLTKKVRSILNK